MSLHGKRKPLPPKAPPERRRHRFYKLNCGDCGMRCLCPKDCDKCCSCSSPMGGIRESFSAAYPDELCTGFDDISTHELAYAEAEEYRAAKP